MLIESIRGNKGERQDDEKSRNNGKDGIPHRSLHHGIVAQNHFLEGTHDVVDTAPYVFTLQGLIRLENQREALKIYVQPEDEEMNEDAVTEKEQLSELKRFYVEKFEGNVLREFYPEGALKSEAEVKEGKRHGRYREYYENGKLRLRGKYSHNQPKGTWKYYTEEGKFERKEKF